MIYEYRIAVTTPGRMADLHNPQAARRLTHIAMIGSRPEISQGAEREVHQLS